MNKLINSLLSLSLIGCGVHVSAQKQRTAEPLSPKSQEISRVTKEKASKWSSGDGERTIQNVITMASGEGLNTLENDNSRQSAYEVLATIPPDDIEALDGIIENEVGRPDVKLPPNEIEMWNIFRQIIKRPSQTVCIGSSTGDPHITTFDGHKYDLMAVGEFTLAKSKITDFEVQARHKKSGPSVSVNSACAMINHGNKISFYSQDSPFGTQKTPLVVNGQPVELENDQIHYLSGGGKITKNRGTYIVDWPEGEQVVVRVSSTSINIKVKVFKSERGNYTGLLGNANGITKDDMQVNEVVKLDALPPFYSVGKVVGGSRVKNSVKTAEKNYNQRIIDEFGNAHRIADVSSFFEYPEGMTTVNFTDLNFPARQHTISNLNKKDLKTAQNKCEAAGVGADDMRGCILDVAFTGDVAFAENLAAMPSKEELVEVLNIKNPVQSIEIKPLSEDKVKAVSKQINKQANKSRNQNMMKNVGKGVTGQPIGDGGTASKGKGNTPKKPAGGKGTSAEAGGSTTTKSPGKTGGSNTPLPTTGKSPSKGGK